MNKANEMAIQIVTEYIKRLERQPVSYWRSSEFAQRSYSKTVACDILRYLQMVPSIPPLQLIEEYRDKVDEYSCLNSKNSFLFSVAKDTAEDIIDELTKAYY